MPTYYANDVKLLELCILDHKASRKFQEKSKFWMNTNNMINELYFMVKLISYNPYFRSISGSLFSKTACPHANLFFWKPMFELSILCGVSLNTVSVLMYPHIFIVKLILHGSPGSLTTIHYVHTVHTIVLSSPCPKLFLLSSPTSQQSSTAQRNHTARKQLNSKSKLQMGSKWIQLNNVLD